MASPNATEWAAILFAVYAALSVFWAPEGSEGLSTIISFALSLFGGFLIFRAARHSSPNYGVFFEIPVILGGLAGFLLLAFDHFSNGMAIRFFHSLLNRELPDSAIRIAFKPALAVSALFIWPWGYALIHRYRFGIYGVLFAIVGLIILDSDTFALAIVFGIAFACCAYFWPHYSSKLISAVLIFSILSMPLFVRGIPDPTRLGSGILAPLSNSALHRLAIWHVTVDKIFEAPLFGHGFDSARMQFNAASSRPTTILPGVSGRTYIVIAEPIPLHPHNFVLQIWLELGLFGAVLLSAFFGLLINQINKSSSRKIKTLFLGFLGSGYAIGCISYGAWQSWWIASLLLSVGALVALTARETNASSEIEFSSIGQYPLVVSPDVQKR